MAAANAAIAASNEKAWKPSVSGMHFLDISRAGCIMLSHKQQALCWATLLMLMLLDAGFHLILELRRDMSKLKNKL